MLKVCLTCQKKLGANKQRQRYCSIFCFHEHPRKSQRQTGKKECVHCNVIKPLSEFYIRKKTKNLRGECIKCTIKAVRQYYSTHTKSRKKAQLRGYKSIHGQWNNYRRSAKKKAIPFGLTKDYFKKLRKENCHYCGTTKSTAYNMGVDRVNSKKGYILNNVVPCCKDCNLAKFDRTPQQFISHVIKMYNYQRSKNVCSKND